MDLIIKNELTNEERGKLQLFFQEMEESSPVQSYIRVVYSAPHKLEIKINSQSLCWELVHESIDFVELIKEVRTLFRARIKKWHKERKLS